MDFLQEVDLFMRHFGLQAKVGKGVMVNRILLSEKSFFDHELRSVNEFSTRKVFLTEWSI